MPEIITENSDIRTAMTPLEISSCYELMLQLRPHLKNAQLFVDQVQRQQQDGYHLVYIQKEGVVKALMGFRYLEFLAWGKVLYIDDLVTDSQKRKSGLAGELIKWTIAQARQSGCDQVHLDSGPQRHDAHRLYLKSGFKIIGYHFALEI